MKIEDRLIVVPLAVLGISVGMLLLLWLLLVDLGNRFLP